ncbi:hypothetical protein NPX13_g10192 [Xylaria arbuscula]|uniref:Uncharacterized protein n=1 Tax=Xylaria arbuscula TaxID=114810 RepID=A0A9W8N5A4_9PEZI|nr:hypothetical protein NPX13_g10192 [Xylaria arbuscula]
MPSRRPGSTLATIFSSLFGRDVESNPTSSITPTSTSASVLSARSLSTGAAVGIGIGVGVATMLVLSFLVFWFLRQKYQAIQQQLTAQNQQYQERLAQSMESYHAPSESQWIPPRIGWGYHQQPMDHNYQYQQGAAAPSMESYYPLPESQPVTVPPPVMVIPNAEWKDQKQHVRNHEKPSELSELDGTFSHTYEMQS